MRFVPAKSPEQQSVLSLHTARESFLSVAGALNPWYPIQCLARALTPKRPASQAREGANAPAYAPPATQIAAKRPERPPDRHAVHQISAANPFGTPLVKDAG